MKEAEEKLLEQARIYAKSLDKPSVVMAFIEGYNQGMLDERREREKYLIELKGTL